MIKVHSIAAPVGSLDSGQQVLRSNDVKSFLTLEELHLRAQKEVNLMREKAQSECNNIKETAYQEAFEQGREAAGRLILSTIAEVTLFRRNSAKTLCESLRATVAKLLGEMDPADVTEKVARQALKKIPGAESVCIRVPTNMESELNQRIDGIAAKFPEIQSITVIPDTALNSSLGCVLETPMGVIDALVSTQLGVLEDVFNDLINEEFSDESSFESATHFECADKYRSTRTCDNAI